MLKAIENIVERILWESRLIVMVAVVSSIVSAVVLALLGAYDVWTVVKDLASVIGGTLPYEKFHREAITHIIGAVDSFLITTVLLIFGVGLYELFISKIDHIEGDEHSARILEIHSLDQLKDKLAKVIVMVLIVTFFKHALKLHYDSMLELLYLAMGILLIALANHFMHKEGKGHTERAEVSAGAPLENPQGEES